MSFEILSLAWATIVTAVRGIYAELQMSKRGKVLKIDKDNYYTFIEIRDLFFFRTASFHIYNSKSISRVLSRIVIYLEFILL